AYVPQAADAILFHETLEQEIRFTMRGRGGPNGEAAMLERAGLVGREADHPRDFSVGERVRTAIVAAVAGHPDVILLDEPTRGMDAAGRDWLATELQAWRDEGRTVIIVTHDVELVARVATRVMLLAAGEIVLDGPVRDVLGESPLFSSQMNKVFGTRSILTIEDALSAAR
ncbi:MAG: ATP-binding cassette domain-containing protein, partial [Actinomycetota bacterium]